MTKVVDALHSRGRILKASFAGAKDYRSDFHGSTAQLTISVGQVVHEGEKLLATIKLINRTFARCKIVLDDSIQWYTLAISSREESPEALIQRAIEAGDHYLNQHEPTFNLFTIPYEIIRWKHWLNTSAWTNAVASMHGAYHEDPILREAIQHNVNTFLDRYERTHLGGNYDRGRSVDLCINYLLEECAVMKDLWIELGCHYEVYPSGRNEAMTATYERYIKPFYPHLLKSIGLRFHRVKKPQVLMKEEKI